MSLFAAAELSGVVNNGNAGEMTTANRFDSTYGIRLALSAGNSASDYISSGTGLGSFTTYWHRFWFYRNNALTTGRAFLQLLNSSGTPVFQLLTGASSTIQAQYWNGSAWVNIGSTYTVPSALSTFDLKLICGASGSFELYRNEVLVLSGAASMGSVNNVDEWRHYAPTNFLVQDVFSEIIWGDEPTLGHRYAIRPPTGNGSDTAGSGTFTDVDEAITNDGDTSALASNGDAETYTHSAMTLPSGTVKAVQIESRVKNASSGAQNVKGRLRIGGTAYDQASNFSGIGLTYNGYRARWASNPAGGAWTQASASDVGNEFGLVAQT